MSADKRKFNRYVFPRGREIIASLRQTAGESSAKVKILNISEGGMGLASGKGDTQWMAEDHELVLEKIQGTHELASLKGVVIRVKWILDYEPLTNIGIGCEFVDLPQATKSDIHSLLNEG